MRAILIEDEAIWRTKLQVMLDELGIEIIDVATNVVDSITLLQKHKPDVIIADILLEHEIVFKVFDFNKQFCDIPTILATQSDKEIHFKQAAMLKKCFYVVKPIHKLTLRSAIDAVCGLTADAEKSKNKSKTLAVKSRLNTKLELPLTSIIYIEQKMHYCHIHTSSKKEFVLKKPLSSLIDDLDETFLRVHRSYCINTLFIDNFLTGLQGVLVSGKQFPIGRINRERVKKFIADTYCKE